MPISSVNVSRVFDACLIDIYDRARLEFDRLRPETPMMNACVNLIKNAYVAGEPMTSELHRRKPAEISAAMHAYADANIRHSAQSQMSGVLMSRKGGPAAVALLASLEDGEFVSIEFSPVLNPIERVLNATYDREIVSKKLPTQPTRSLCISILATDPSYQGRGLMVPLLTASLCIAWAKRFTHAFTIATSGSQVVLDRLGATCINETRYDAVPEFKEASARWAAHKHPITSAKFVWLDINECLGRAAAKLTPR